MTIILIKAIDLVACYSSTKAMLSELANLGLFSRSSANR